MAGILPETKKIRPLKAGSSQSADTAAKVKDSPRDGQRITLLADFHDTARCGARTKQCDGNQVHDALRGIAIPVDDFIEQIVRVLLRADCRHAAIQIHPLLAGGDVGFRDVCRYVEVRRAFRAP